MWPMPHNPIHVRRMTGTLNAATAVIGVATVWLVVRLLLPLPPWLPPGRETAPASTVDIAPRPAASLAELAVIWQRDLRQPVIDAPPQKPKPQAPEPKLAIELLGTAVEADAQYGIFRLADNSTVVKPVGQRVGEFEIVAIGRGSARLRNGRREYELRVPWYERIEGRKD